jgi:lipid A ethanolaminephosphotransferase
MALYAVLPSLLIAFVRIDHRPIGAKLKWNMAFITPLLLLALVMTLWQFSGIASTLRNNRIIIKPPSIRSPRSSARRVCGRRRQDPRYRCPTAGP